MNIDYYKNNTSLEIIKLDEEKEEPLSYVVFNIYGENNDLVFENVRTDKDGKIFLEGLLPGKYIIKEISTKEGYMLLDEEVEEPEEPEELEIPEEPEKPEEPKISVEPEEPKKIILPEKPKQPKKVLPLTGY